MIKTYIRVDLSSEGESPKQVIERMRKIGAVPVVGDYDFELALGDDERLFDKLEEIHHTLRGSSVRYTVTTRTDVEAEGSARSRQQVMHYVDQKPVELKKSLYKAKLERWKDMGLDVSELERLLDRDLDKFKAASKDFLKTHLDRLSIIKDKHPPENRIDGEILALLDEDGKTMEQIITTTGYFEDQVTLSIGRLISAGSARRLQRNSVEVFCLVPPPAPQIRKAVEVVPAMSEDEAKARVYENVPPDGVSFKELFRAAKLPREQLAKAIESLEGEGKIRSEKRGKKENLYRL
jgi:predicted Rossmann fold nucleotide-binding protein DprA/Smf involved in DNA uptake